MFVIVRVDPGAATVGCLNILPTKPATVVLDPGAPLGTWSRCARQHAGLKGRHDRWLLKPDGSALIELL
jgi:hypothetical protein